MSTKKLPPNAREILAGLDDANKYFNSISWAALYLDQGIEKAIKAGAIAPPFDKHLKAWSKQLHDQLFGEKQ